MDALKTAQETKKENRNDDEAVVTTMSISAEMSLDSVDGIEFESLTKTTEIMSSLDETKISKKEIKDAKYDFIENKIDRKAGDVELPGSKTKSEKNFTQPLNIDALDFQLEINHQSQRDEIKIEKKRSYTNVSAKHDEKERIQDDNKIHFEDDVAIEEVPIRYEAASNIKHITQSEDASRVVAEENKNVEKSLYPSRKAEKCDPAIVSDARKNAILPPIDKITNNKADIKDKVHTDNSAGKDPAVSTIVKSPPSPVSAARVLRVTGRSHSGLSRKTLFVIIVLTLILVAGGGYVFYEQKKLMLPMIAQVPQLVDSKLSSITDKEFFFNQQSTQHLQIGGDIENKNVMSSDSSTNKEIDKNLSQDNELKQITKPPATKKMVASLGNKKAVVENKKMSIETQATKKRAPVKVRKGVRQIDPIEKVLRAAYEAYQIGDDRSASTLYGQVIRRDASNRDALLGLAAVSTRLGSYQPARDYYITLLRLNNRDLVARSGLISLLSDVDPLAAESELKFLLAKERDASYLHFALGSALVRQGKWADAEEAFFDAFRIDGDNADYAYNLAVSLDRLGQKKNALSYYEKANSLARSRVSSFDSSIVQKRIDALKHNTQMTQ